MYEGPLVNGVVRKLLGASCRYSVDSGFIPVDAMGVSKALSSSMGTIQQWSTSITPSLRSIPFSYY